MRRNAEHSFPISGSSASYSIPSALFCFLTLRCITFVVLHHSQASRLRGHARQITPSNNRHVTAEETRQQSIHGIAAKSTRDPKPHNTNHPGLSRNNHRINWNNPTAPNHPNIHTNPTIPIAQTISNNNKTRQNRADANSTVQFSNLLYKQISYPLYLSGSIILLNHGIVGRLMLTYFYMGRNDLYAL